MVKQNSVDLASQQHRQNHSAQELRPGPSVRHRHVKDQGIHDPKHVGVYAGSVDDPLGTLVEQRIVIDREIDGSGDQGCVTGGI
mmetsp:Transcript_10979/g.12667  ORF Transcript_10979/g.12667 Transcript_10979/m.12667 type:complete len:84 (+) Transcript_10979:78-329(+)